MLQQAREIHVILDNSEGPSQLQELLLVVAEASVATILQAGFSLCPYLPSLCLYRCISQAHTPKAFCMQFSISDLFPRSPRKDSLSHELLQCPLHGLHAYTLNSLLQALLNIVDTMTLWKHKLDQDTPWLSFSLGVEVRSRKGTERSFHNLPNHPDNSSSASSPMTLPLVHSTPATRASLLFLNLPGKLLP